MPVSRASLYEHDRTWAWKAILRAFAIIFNIIGIGLTAWALAVTSHWTSDTSNSYYYYYPDDTYAIPWNLITFSLSFIWCLANLCVLLVHSRWIHPGANVGCDLFLWLLFIVTSLFSTVGFLQDLLWSDSYYNQSDTYTSGATTYAHYPNGTSYEVTPSNPAPRCPGYNSCAEKDAVPSARHKRGVVVTVATVLAWLLLLIHLALFISACRYTHERRKTGVFNDKLKSETEKIEENIIRRLEAEGRLRTPPAAMVSTAPETAAASGAVGANQSHLGGGSGSIPPPEIRVDPASPAGHGIPGQPYSTSHQEVATPAPLPYPDRGQDIEANDRITHA